MGNLYCTMFTHCAGGFEWETCIAQCSHIVLVVSRPNNQTGIKGGHLSELASSTMAQAAGAASRGRGRGRGRQRGRGRRGTYHHFAGI